MRITGGSMRSRIIKTLDGSDTRPTSDKVRAAIFNRFVGFDGLFLDCFGGSGAMSIEAISRGAEGAVIFEYNRNAVKVIESNINELKIQGLVKVLQGDSLQLIAKLTQKFDLVFIDPPYGYKDMVSLVEKIIDQDCLNMDATIIIEADMKDSIPEKIKDYDCIKSKKYGQTMVYYYEKAAITQ